MIYVLTQIAFLVASALFILALHWMNTPETARKGVYAGVAATALAIIFTWADPSVIHHMWIIVALVPLIQAMTAIGAGASATGFDLSTVLSVRLIFYFAVFFSLGYLLYSVLFAVVAVTCTSTEELGQSMMAAVLPMVVALIASMSVIANPASTTTRVLSLIPFFTPLVMLARVNILMPPLWEVWLGVAILLASAVASAWAAAKIFRYSLLMTGKRPTLPELMRVVRAG